MVLELQSVILETLAKRFPKYQCIFPASAFNFQPYSRNTSSLLCFIRRLTVSKIGYVLNNLNARQISQVPAFRQVLLNTAFMLVQYEYSRKGESLRTELISFGPSHFLYYLNDEATNEVLDQFVNLGKELDLKIYL